VLDGLPRNVNQAKLLGDTIEVLKVIHLQADMTKMVERLRRRALKENRFDDANDTVIQRRLVEYEQKTRPVLEYYPQDKIVRVDAMRSQISVLNELIGMLVPLKEMMDRATEEKPVTTSAPVETVRV